MLMISVCMIVKDEARHLEKTLQALVPHFDDIVVVDTGSTDPSREIARQFVPQVHEFRWVDDFSAARNHSIQFARHDWVLVIDADETLAALDAEPLLALMQAQPDAVGRINMINHAGENEETERINRLFRKSRYGYQGLIHEQICPHADAPNFACFDAPITLHHLGYQTDILQEKDKLNRNVKLLEAALSLAPEDPYLHYQLGKTHYIHRNYPAACTCLERSLQLQAGHFFEYSEDLIETYGYALINSGQYTQALKVLDYEKYCPSTDFVFLKALIYMNNADMQQAVDHFLACTRMPPGRKKGVHSFKALYNIGVILECLGNNEDALVFYQNCEGYSPALEGITRLHATKRPTGYV